MKLGIYTDRIANKCATKVVAVSEVVRDILTEREGVDDSKIVLIRNGIDTKYYEALDTPRRKCILSDRETIRIGAVSRLTNWKGLQYTIEAFKMLLERFPNAHLEIVGAPGDATEMIDEKLAGLDKQSFTLESWNPNVDDFLTNLSIFVHVPIGRVDEAFGLVYLEALALGVPSIFTLSGVLNELPNPECYAKIVPYEDSKAILRAMLEVIEHGSNTIKELPSSWLDCYSLTHMRNEYMKLLVNV